MTPTHPMTLFGIDLIRRALADGPLDMHALAIAAHRSESCLQKYLRRLHYGVADPSARQLHIVKWVRYGVTTIWIAVYAWGPGSDAKRPKSKTRAQCNEGYHKRRQRDKDRLELHLAKRRARAYARKAKATPQTWLSALGAP